MPGVGLVTAATLLAALLLTVGEDAVRAVVVRLVAVLRATVTTPSVRTLTGPASGPVPTGRRVRPLGGRAPPLQAC